MASRRGTRGRRIDPNESPRHRNPRAEKLATVYTIDIGNECKGNQMARPKIGIFGALVAVGSVLAWRWAQKHRASQARLAGELNRWEAEGGALASTTQEAPSTLGSHVSPGTMSNGHAQVGGTADAWHFPHS
jgi:hypothetical protein